MQKISVKLPSLAARHYPIFIGKDLLAYPKEWMPKNISFNRIVIITDSNVRKKYGNDLLKRLKKLNYSAILIDFPAGESSKTNSTKQKIESKMFQAGCARDTLIIALGGGVVGDLAGFVAATFMRGIPYIQIPTTLLAMVDSSVGGKTAIDTKEGKNLIGAFWQPLAVVADVDCLKTLPKAHFICGLVEAFKMFATSDAKSFRAAEKNIFKNNRIQWNSAYIPKLIYNAVAVKAGVVGRDEKEKGERSILNCGHTIGHAIEKIADYKILHGIAVGLGILIEAKIAEKMDILSRKDGEHIQALLAKLGISRKMLQKYSIPEILKATVSDKKTHSGKVRYVLLKKIGAVHQAGGAFTHAVSEHAIREAFTWER